MNTAVHITQSAQATEVLGRTLAQTLRQGVVVTLTGDLGAGKTVFSRGVARGLGITEPVTSPTFTVVQEYALGTNRYLYHLDMYRIEGEEAALAFGIEEFLYAPNAVALVEWPERIEGLLDQRRTVRVHLEHVDALTRRIHIPPTVDVDEQAPETL